MEQFTSWSTVGFRASIMTADAPNRIALFIYIHTSCDNIHSTRAVRNFGSGFGPNLAIYANPTEIWFQSKLWPDFGFWPDLQNVLHFNQLFNLQQISSWTRSRVGACESAVCIRNKSRVESGVKIRIRIESRIESAVRPWRGTACRTTAVGRYRGAPLTRDVGVGAGEQRRGRGRQRCAARQPPTTREPVISSHPKIA